MGEVYLAEDTRLERRVALKFLPVLFTQDQTHLRRFEQEARTIAALSHPHVCVIHEVVKTGDGSHCLVMEYVEGVTLREHLAKGPMKVSDALDVAVQVASALSTAHASGNRAPRHQAGEHHAPERCIREDPGLRAGQAD